MAVAVVARKLPRQHGGERLYADHPADGDGVEPQHAMQVERQRSQRQADRQKAEEHDGGEWQQA